MPRGIYKRNRLDPRIRAEYLRLQRNAGSLVQAAQISGKLGDPRLFACIDCGWTAFQYDHRDYFKPLEVEPVCTSCNTKRGFATATIEKLLAAVEQEQGK